MDIFLNLDFKKILFLIFTVVFFIFIFFVLINISFYFIPFIVAFIISLLVEPLIKFMTTKLKLSRKLSAFICLVSIFFLLGGGLFLGITKIVTELSNLSRNIPLYSEIITKNIENITSYASDFYFSLPPKVTTSLENAFLEISNKLSNYLDFIVKKTLNTAISLPNAFIFLLVTIVSTYFFISDKDLISSKVKEILPKKIIRFITIIKTESFSATSAYIKSQLIIASITTVQLVIGFYILRMKNILTLSVLLFLLDLIPLIGVGSVLIPWGLYELVFDSSYQGIGLLLLYCSILIIRNITEPKILSTQIGFHPLIVLMRMYIGFKLLGVGGIILGPLTIMFSKNIILEIYNSYSKTTTRDHLIRNLCKDEFYQKIYKS